MLASELQKIIDDRSVSLFRPRHAGSVDLSLDYMHSEKSHKRRKLSGDTYSDDHLTSSKMIPDMLLGLVKSYSQSLKSECEDLVQHAVRILESLSVDSLDSCH